MKRLFKYLVSIAFAIYGVTLLFFTESLSIGEIKIIGFTFFVMGCIILINAALDSLMKSLNRQ